MSSHTFCLMETGGKITSLNLEIHNSRPHLEMQGRIEDGILLISLRSGLGERNFSLPLPHPSLPFYALSPFLSPRKLKEGNTFSLPALDPLKSLTGGDPQSGDIRFQVVSGDDKGYHLRAFYAGVDIDIYLNQGGEVIEIDTPLGWKLKRQSHNQVMAFLKQKGNNINDESRKVNIQRSISNNQFSSNGD